MVYLGADHRGFELKQAIYQYLLDLGYQVTDLGNNHLDPNDDFPEFALKVSQAVINDSENRGILFCGSGVGVDIVANKVDGIRCALVDNLRTTISARQDDNVNVVSLPADTLDIDLAKQIIEVFLKTEFSGDERFTRRIDQIQEIEKDN